MYIAIYNRIASYPMNIIVLIAAQAGRLSYSYSKKLKADYAYEHEYEYESAEIEF